jgi:8-oxo-dGTP pyrophosphatase MutT (NUDIX family)
VTAPITQLSSRLAYESPWLRVREDEIRYASGRPGLYSYIDKADFALIIPYDVGGFWLVEQYRYPVQQRMWEFPQGGWPTGQTGTQESLARTELREEVGATAARLEHLGHQFASYGYSNQGFDVYLASGLSLFEPDREETEQDMRHQWFSEAELVEMIANGQLQDAHSIAAWALLQVWRQRTGPR